MTKKTANEEKKTRSIRVTSKGDFLTTINEVKELINDSDFDDAICESTANGLYKFSTTQPTDMTGVKTTEVQGLKWYKIPTTDYRISLTSYIQFRMTSDAKARANAIKKLSELTTDELLALLQK